MADAPPRISLRVRGLVQGVGFRPHLFALATRMGLTGWVMNDGAGVLAEVQGPGADALLTALAQDPPPLARIDDILARSIPPQPGESGFTIRASGGGAARTMIGADAGVCEACLAELFNPLERRYRYPFLNCTHCGPRYTITRALPYDRPQTSMAGFALCDSCAREYGDPNDRRFHAQPIACPACGPRLSHSIEEILARIVQGGIVALKGLGGFHLVCDAKNPAAVAELRRRKARDDKPFAVMVANLPSAAALAECPDEAASLLSGPERPIVLLRQRAPASSLAPTIAPGLPWLGLLLPYTPLHYLLFHEAAGRPDGTAWLDQPQDLALVMTSANPGGEPLVIGNDEAHNRLGPLADLVVTHDRDILVRADDSVLRTVGYGHFFIRRARGYTPRPIALAHSLPPVVGLGGHLKATLTVIRDQEAFVSQHLGDLDTAAGIGFFEEALAHLLSVLEVEPALLVHDRHPDFFSSRFAASSNLPTLAVQHHHAHIAAIAAEHRITEPLLGLALDGFGLGDDGGAWGGELLEVAGPTFTRLGHLAPLPQPGGDRAAREPWRMAAAALWRMGRAEDIPRRFPSQAPAKALPGVLERGFNCPSTSSCGRLFDAAAGLLGLCPTTTFEGQAAMRLEALVRRPTVMAGGWTLQDGVLDLLPLLTALVDLPADEGADLFHGTLAAALVDWTVRAASAGNMGRVALAGGCLLNAVLAAEVTAGLRRHGLEVLTARALPPNDGGLSLGQAWIGGLTLRQR